jgi:hypothetical protein
VDHCSRDGQPPAQAVHPARLAGLGEKSETPIVVMIRARGQRAGSEGAALVLMRSQAAKEARMAA